MSDLSEAYPFGAHPYLVLKLARELFQKSPNNLEPPERKRVDHVAARQSRIEQRILDTLEAAQVIIPASSLNTALTEIRARYASEEDYLTDLAHAGLHPASLKTAVQRDLKLNAVLERIASQSAAVSATDVEIFYLIHREKFRRAENRTLRHILVTIDEQVSGSERLMAYRKADGIRARLLKDPKAFSDLALRHSECPTALNGGLLGTVQRGTLYAELETAAFALKAGELSEIVESPLGFHLMQCVTIEAACILPLAAVQDQIATHLEESRRSACQKAWISGLLKQVA